MAVERFAVARLAVARGFFAPVALARLAAGLRAELFARVPVELLAADLRADVFLRAAGFLRVDVFLAAGFRAEEVEPVADALALQLPDITRCAASATASAIKVPSLAALDATLLAAACAVSAASSPASRIALRALGLALIAAAAAARPAASISLLIAALAILSTVVFDPDDLREVERVELFFGVFAMTTFPPLGKRHFKPVTVP